MFDWVLNTPLLQETFYFWEDKKVNSNNDNKIVIDGDREFYDLY